MGVRMGSRNMLFVYQSVKISKVFFSEDFNLQCKYNAKLDPYFVSESLTA